MKFNFKEFSLYVKIGFDDPCKQYRGKSLREISYIVSISAPTLSRALNGKRLDVDTIIALCFFLDLEITDYFIY